MYILINYGRIKWGTTGGSAPGVQIQLEYLTHGHRFMQGDMVEGLFKLHGLDSMPESASIQYFVAEN